MKKWISFLIIFVFLSSVALAACSGENTGSQAEDRKEQVEADVNSAEPAGGAEEAPGDSAAAEIAGAATVETASEIAGAAIAATVDTAAADIGGKAIAAADETAAASDETAGAADPRDSDTPAVAAAGIDYLALVNKLNPLPEGWEEALETVTITNSVGDEVEVEKKACEAYEALKEDLEQNEGIYLELDSARRSVEEQQRIMDDFIKKYGADYAARTVAEPGYSEHHTGLALDLYFKLKDGDGTFTDVYKNEDMVRYPEIWEKIHARLADYGFILRYLEGKEHITGYGYEPWHIRYINDVNLAKKIMEQDGMTLEAWLGAVTDTDPEIETGTSALYSEEELQAAVVQIKCKFASFRGCELHSIRYAGDEAVTAEDLEWLNSLTEGAGYTKAAEFLSDFHTAPDELGAWNPDEEYRDYQWWLGWTEEDGWEVVSWGYG